MAVKQNVPYLRVLSQANPAAGANLTIRATGQGLWRVISVAFSLVTDATVANRAVSLHGSDGTSVFYHGTVNNVQAASLTTQYGAYAGAAVGGISGVAQQVALPENGLWLEPGWELETDINNLQAGDQVANVAFLVEEFPTGPSTEWTPTVDRAEYERS